MRRLASFIVLAVATALAAGCAIPPRGPAVPSSETVRALPLGIPNARFFADDDPAPMLAEAARALERERAALRAAGRPTTPMPPASFLAVSGGSDNGAFGAGLINGWTTTGTRPEFRIVTGVSTGALIAPFAYLGPDYDPTLREIYTTTGPERVFRRRRLLAALFDDAMADTGPLAETIAHFADHAMFNAIAREYHKGRLLLVSTTDLDAQRPVIWNIGAIAASRHPKSLDLFRKILLASASIPGAFQPVLLDVEIDGARFQEMHVDGGAIAQLFLYPQSIDPGLLAVERPQSAFVIRNARLDPEHAEIERRTLTIAGRAISTMLAASGYNDVLRAYFLTKRDGVDYNLAYIGSDFKVPRDHMFDHAYMRALYDYGYQQAVRGRAWHKTPPGLHTRRAGRQEAAALGPRPAPTW
ncbi:MAG: patatin family protein [Rhodospirillales bacterium]|nr:patatin family protein [Rhodospirillales bacterium]